MVLLGTALNFPPVETASTEGILAFGGDLRPERLALAYRSGIFPWYNEGEPIIWYSPDPRMVLFPEEIKISKSMQRLLRKQIYSISWNKAFTEVIEQCQKIYRKDQRGTWITQEMKQAYIALHDLGMAKSVEVWRGDVLVGGLYGIDLGHVFCGESMFSAESNTSKIAFIHLVEQLGKQGYRCIDCQVYNTHLASLGAREIPRQQFMKLLSTTNG